MGSGARGKAAISEAPWPSRKFTSSRGGGACPGEWQLGGLEVSAGRGSGCRSLHFPPSGEATSRRSWSPLAAPQGAGALDTPLGPALPPTPAPPAALGFPLLTREVGRILSAPSRGHARSREGRRKLGKGLWACCGPGAGSPHVTPNDQLLWPTREAGWVVTETKGRPPPSHALSRAPILISHPQNLGVPSGGRRHLPATQNLPEASVASSWGAGPSPGQVWSSPGLTSVCRVCGCPGVLTASPQPPAKGRGAEMGAGGAWGLGLGAALGPGLEAPLASSVRESRRAVAFGGGAAAPCPASRGSPSAWKGLIPSPFLSKRPPCLPSHLSGSGSQPHGQARTGPRCGLGTQSCL